MAFPKSLQITNCYDSHVHWLATGEQEFRYDLSGFISAADVKKLSFKQSCLRGDWVIGFGWDQYNWKDGSEPTRELLDEAFPTQPVVFSRADGHALWMNTEALKRASYFYQNPVAPDGGKIDMDDNGWPTGVVYEVAAETVRKILPELTNEQIQARLLAGALKFNQAGFTHIRDLSGNESQWSATRSLEEKTQLNICVNQLFGVESGRNFHDVLQAAKLAKSDESPQMKVQGVKVFLDGSLGSETAYLSQKYASADTAGMCLIERFTLKEMLLETWSNGLALAVHAIGDAAFHLIAGVAHELWERGEQGLLHIEHGQMARPESIELLDNQMTQIHMQPCHFLSDQRWLKNKLGDLYQHVFPWKNLEQKKINTYFGSDSPIERPSLFDNFKAVEQANTAGILPPDQDLIHFHSLPTSATEVQGRTEIIDGSISRVTLGERDVFIQH